MPACDPSTLTDEELAAHVPAVNAEMANRQQQMIIPGQMAELNKQYLDATGVVQGQAWVQPMGAHDAYPKDWRVVHMDLPWISLIDANVWEPGIANWREDSGDEFPDWVQPTGSHDAYAAGAKVRHLELHWISDVDANTWEPGVYGWTEAT